MQFTQDPIEAVFVVAGNLSKFLDERDGTLFAVLLSVFCLVEVDRHSGHVLDRLLEDRDDLVSNVFGFDVVLNEEKITPSCT